MKKIIFYFSLLLIMVSCNKCCKNNDETKDANFVKAYHGGHDITFQQACYSALDFLIDDDRYNFAKDIGYGGFISKNTVSNLLEDPKSETGINFYMCYDGKFFLSYKRVDKFDLDDDQLNINSNDKLYCSNNYIKYSEQKPDTITDIKNFLKANPKMTSPNVKNVTQKDVRSYAIEFQKKFKNKSGGFLNDKYHVYIPYKELIEIMSEPECVGLEHYFSFDETENKNKIRLFFIGVKKDASGTGSLIYENNEYHMILERAWP